MPLTGLDLALIAAIFAGILLLFAGLTFGFARVRVQKWIGGAIGRFMQNLATQAAEEEGATSESSPSGALNLGGLKIDAGTIQSIAEILKVVQSLGFLKGGSGGTHPFLKP